MVRQNTCRDCFRAEMRERQRPANEFIAAYKLRVGCMDCGWNKHPQALEFDHRPDEIKCFDVSDMRNKPLEEIAAEIEKCDVVCANCHRIRTFDRLDYRRNVLSDLRRVAIDALVEPDLLALLDD